MFALYVCFIEYLKVALTIVRFYLRYGVVCLMFCLLYFSFFLSTYFHLICLDMLKELWLHFEIIISKTNSVNCTLYTLILFIVLEPLFIFFRKIF